MTVSVQQYEIAAIHSHSAQKQHSVFFKTFSKQSKEQKNKVLMLHSLHQCSKFFGKKKRILPAAFPS